MANENILAYLRGNKEKYPIEVLRKKLAGAGYPLDQIEEGIRVVYGGETPSLPSSKAKTSFWDFRSVRVYRSGGEKIIDALFGFFVVGIFAPWLIFSIFRSLVGFPIILLFDIGSIMYLWRRRRFMAFGTLSFFGLSLLSGFFLGYAFYSLSGSSSWFHWFYRIFL